MPSLASAAALDSTIFQSPTKHAFAGTLFPADEGKIYPDNFFTLPLLLRVAPDCPVGAGDEMLDAQDRRYLILEYDITPYARTHRLSRLNNELPWTRTARVADVVTGLWREGVPQPMGDIWVAMELLSRETSDSQIQVRQDNFRMVTRHRLTLGDKVGPYTVKRVDYPLGVCVAEVQ